MSKFVDMFRHSPFKPLREHMAKVMECVALVKPMFEAVRDDRRDDLEVITKDVFKTEHDADIIKNEIRETIPKTFYLPVYRGDLLAHLKLQDDMADAAEDLAYLLTIKKLSLPAAIVEQTMQYLQTVLDVCSESDKATTLFQTVADQGFDSEDVSEVIRAVQSVEKLEWESDRAQYKLSQALFALENEVPPLDIMLWSKAFEKLGELANVAENVAGRIRRMITSR